MVSLYAKIPKDFEFLGLSNVSIDMFIPLVSNVQSVLSAQAPMESFCNAIMCTVIFSLSQRWAFKHYVASALLHNLHFELTTCFSIFALIALVRNACSWAAVSNPSVSFLNSPFFNHVQERLLVTPSCSCSCFLLVFIIIIIIIIVVVVVVVVVVFVITVKCFYNWNVFFFISFPT